MADKENNIEDIIARVKAEESNRGKLKIFFGAMAGVASLKTSSVTTVNRTSGVGPKLVEIATSAASRPRAMTMRPIRG